MPSPNVITFDRNAARGRRAGDEQELAGQIHLLAAALDNTPHGLCMVDADARLILCNPAFIAMYRLPPALTELRTTREAILQHGFSTGQGPISGVSEYLARSAEAEPGQSIIGELALADGRTIRISHTPIQDGGYVATHEDITDRVAASAKIEFLAYRDTLTGLPNRTESSAVSKPRSRLPSAPGRCSASSWSTSTTSRTSTTLWVTTPATPFC